MTMPGPGDTETWGPPTGHPNDPRTPDPTYYEVDDDEAEVTDHEPDWEAIAESIAEERHRDHMHYYDLRY